MNDPDDVVLPDSSSGGMVSEAGISGRTLERLGCLLAGLDQLDLILALPDFPAVLDPPLKFAEYSLLSRVGSGRFGIVLLADDSEMNRLIVVKVPQPVVLAEPESLERFIREPRAAARLDHPGVVSVLTTGVFEGLPFLSAVYVPGPSLARWSDQHPQPCDPQDAVRFFRGVAEAAHHAHERGVLHCDLSPSNILLQPLKPDAAALREFRPVITDFGLARIIDDDPSHTKTFRIAGTPIYMAPEQTTGLRRTLTARVDVYAMGAILRELLSGRISPTDESKASTAEMDTFRHSSRQKLPAHVSKDLRAVCDKCLRLDPGERYESAAALAADLDCLLHGKSVSARSLPTAQMALRWMRRNPRYVTFILLAIASFVFSLLLAVDRRIKEVRGKAELAAAQLRADVSEDRERVAESLTILDQVRLRRMVRASGWKSQNESDLQKIARKLPTEFLPTLRSELSGVEGGFDFGVRRDLDVGSRPYDVAFAPDSQTVAVGSFLPNDTGSIEIRLIDIESGVISRALNFSAHKEWEKNAEGRRDAAWSIAFDSEQRYLVAGTRSGQVIVWDLHLPQSLPWREWTHIDSPKKHNSGKHRRVSRCGFDQEHRLWTENDGSVAVWDPDQQWKLVEQYAGYMTRPTTAATAGPIAAEEHFHVRDPVTGMIVRREADDKLGLCHEKNLIRNLILPEDDSSDDNKISDMCLDPIGEYFFAAAEHAGHLKVWDLSGGRLVAERTINEGSLRMSINPDGTLLAICEADRVAIFEINRPRCRSIQSLHPLPIADAALSRDEKLFAIASESREHESGDYVFDVRLQPVNSRSATLTRCNIKSPSGNSRICVNMNSSCDTVVTCSEDRLLAIAGSTGSVIRGKRVQDLRNLSITHSGELCLNDRGMLRFGVLDHETASSAAETPSVEYLLSVASDRNGVFAGTRNGNIFSFADSRTPTLSYKAASTSITAIAANGERIVAGTIAGEIVIIEGGEIKIRIPAAHHDQIQAIAVGPDGGFISGGVDRVVRLWDANGRLFCEWPQARPVQRLWISRSEQTAFVLCNGENAIHAWNVASLNDHFSKTLESVRWHP